MVPPASPLPPYFPHGASLSLTLPILLAVSFLEPPVSLHPLSPAVSSQISCTFCATYLLLSAAATPSLRRCESSDIPSHAACLARQRFSSSAPSFRYRALPPPLDAHLFPETRRESDDIFDRRNRCPWAMIILRSASRASRCLRLMALIIRRTDGRMTSSSYLSRARLW